MPKGDLLVTNGKLITPIKTYEKGYVAIESGIVKELGEEGENGDFGGVKQVDADGNYVVPGFVDIHVHGGGGGDVMGASIESLTRVAQTHAKGGTTSFLPTLLTAPIEEIDRVLDRIDEAARRSLNGARVLGAHLEGPYFSMEQVGAQNPKYIKEPDPHEYLDLLDRHKSIMRISAAPELKGGLQLGRELSKRRILASIGHSNATYQEVLAAIEAGYSHVTHVFSGMSGLKRITVYRISGVIESTLLLDELTTEMIADGHHLPPSLMKLVLKTKGLERVCVVTDAISAAGLGPGRYTVGGLDVLVEDDISEEFEVPRQEGNYVAKLLDRNSFAGSVATMNRLVRNMVTLVGLSLQDAVKTATLNPARILGVDREVGMLAPGLRGDIVVLDDQFNVLETVVGGEIVYEKTSD